MRFPCRRPVRQRSLNSARPPRRVTPRQPERTPYSEPGRAESLFDRETGAFTGDIAELIDRIGFQGYLWKERIHWQRRIVQTITFADEETHRRSMSIDINGIHLAAILNAWDHEHSAICLPVLAGMIPGPILDIDAKDGQNRVLSIARRHENNEAITFQLMSALLDADSIREWHWISEAAQTIYRFLKHQIPTTDVFHDHIGGIEQLPESVKGIAKSPGFTDELNRLREHYTLHVIYTPHRNGDRFVRDDVLKVSWLERSIPASSWWLESLATRMLPRPAPYEIALPLLNSSKRAGTHIRILAPEEMQIGGIAISFGEHELPLLPSQPHRNTSSSTPEPAEPGMRIITDDPVHPFIELNRNRRQIEILTHPDALHERSDDIASLLTDIPGPGADQPICKATVTFIPDRSHFAISAVLNLLLTLLLLSLSYRYLWDSNAAEAGPTTLLSLLPPLVTMYIATPHEHAIMAESQASGRLGVIIASCAAFSYAAVETFNGSHPALRVHMPQWLPDFLGQCWDLPFLSVIGVCTGVILYLVTAAILTTIAQIDALRLYAYFRNDQALLSESIDASEISSYRRELRREGFGILGRSLLLLDKRGRRFISETPPPWRRGDGAAPPQSSGPPDTGAS